MLGYTPLLEVTDGSYVPTLVVLICIKLFCERVIPPWNRLDITNADLPSFAAFKRLVKRSDLSEFTYFS